MDRHPAQAARARTRRAVLAILVAMLPLAPAAASEPAGGPVAVETLVREALGRNPEICAARHEHEAAEQRAISSRALEDPQLELGVVNAPLPSFSLRREDMTMKMLGLTQKLPYPGKRDLREAVATAESVSIGSAVDETANRVTRDVRVAYEELRLAFATEQILTRTRDSLRDFVSIAAARFEVGQAAQSDVLRAQAQVVQVQQELLRIGQQRAARESELKRLLGRLEAGPPIVPTTAMLLPLRSDADTLVRQAAERRPQLLALDALVQKSDRAIELAQREYYPDFELRLGYGQRERAPDGMPRDDMITMTVAVNLPLWRKSRLEPRVAEARAMRRQAAAMADAQRLDTRASLEQQFALESQTRESVNLYRTTLLPQVRAVVQSALGAYRVGRVDFLTLLDAQIKEFEAIRGEAEAVAGHNRAIAEIDFLTGAAPTGAAAEGTLP
jgi:outer membrane protein, heavy metal efflux system